jgi:cyclopropane fatty-acyl-phospholipid synthase-like methyltransferase
MWNEKLLNGDSFTDKDFDILLPEEHRTVAFTHWTPLNIIEKVVEFIKDNKCQKVLDIGSGVGKFCLIGASLSNAHFHGVEIRKQSHLYALSLAKATQLNNISFANQNICDVDFLPYDCFYYYNPFFENIDANRSIDNSLVLSEQNYQNYVQYIKTELNKKEEGTFLISFHTNPYEIPNSYKMLYEFENLFLCFWKKM